MGALPSRIWRVMAATDGRAGVERFALVGRVGERSIDLIDDRAGGEGFAAPESATTTIAVRL